MQQGKNKKKYMKEPILFPVCREVPGTEGGVIPQEGFVDACCQGGRIQGGRATDGRSIARSRTEKGYLGEDRGGRR